MFTYASSLTSSLAPLAAVLTDGGAAAARALASYTTVLEDTETAAALAEASYAVVLADGCAAAFSASVLSAIVRALLVDPSHFDRCGPCYVVGRQ
jgi:hypothetical protein